MLGELYPPRGLAKETAQVVLEADKPFACNVAWGCPNDCRFPCYGPLTMRQSRSEYLKVKLPKEPPVQLVKRQFEAGLRPEGVILSFITDPFLKVNWKNTETLVGFLLENGVRVAVLSKMDVSYHEDVRHGITVVSLENWFWKTYEPHVPSPVQRLLMLENKADQGEYTWLSMEPCPCPSIWPQDINELLERIKFVRLIILGKWNYDSRANTPEAREEYRGIVEAVRDFCRSNQIRLHVKSDTLKFIADDE